MRIPRVALPPLKTGDFSWVLPQWIVARPQLDRAMAMTSRIAERTPHLLGSAPSYRVCLSDALVALEVVLSAFRFPPKGGAGGVV